VNLFITITHHKKTAIGVGIVLILLAVFVFSLPRKGAAAGSTYQIEVAKSSSLSTTVEATGTVRAYQSARLVWQTSGVVESVDAQLGDVVKADDVLAVLGRDSLPKNVVLAEADLVSAQLALDDLLGSAETDRANAAISLRAAQEAYDDALHYREQLNDLVEYDVFKGFRGIKTPMGYFKVPKIEHIEYYPTEEQKTEADQDVALRKAELEDAQRAYEKLKGGPNPQDIAAAETHVTAAQATLNQAKIIAPFNGTITDIDVKAGDRVSSGNLAYRLDDLSKLLIDLDVSEVDINTVSVGQEVSINLDAVQGKTYRGVVTEIAGTGSSSTGGVNFRVTVALTDPDEHVKPGMTAAVLIQVRHIEDALLVPNQAVRMLGDQRVVYVLRGDDTLEAIEVRLGAKDDTHSEVVGGNLKEGDLIVLDPPTTIDTGSNGIGNTFGG
jgi:HlyD family secretion protein